jgi:hypothetical protein
VSLVRRTIGRVAFALTLVAAVAATQFDEYGVKSAFVYNFLHFAEWPQERLTNGDPWVICVFNDSPIVRTLNSQVTEPVRGRPVRVRTTASLSDLSSCHIVFLPERATGHVPEVLSRYPLAGLLIVTEDQQATRVDGAINLVVAGGRVTFDVNLVTAKEQGVVLSSRLVSLARRVVGTDER